MSAAPQEIRIDGFVATRRGIASANLELAYDVKCPCEPRCSLFLELRLPAKSIAAVNGKAELAKRLQALIELHNSRVKVRRA